MVSDFDSEDDVSSSGSEADERRQEAAPTKRSADADWTECVVTDDARDL